MRNRVGAHPSLSVVPGLRPSRRSRVGTPPVEVDKAYVLADLSVDGDSNASPISDDVDMPPQLTMQECLDIDYATKVG